MFKSFPPETLPPSQEVIRWFAYRGRWTCSLQEADASWVVGTSEQQSALELLTCVWYVTYGISLNHHSNSKE